MDRDGWLCVHSVNTITWQGGEKSHHDFYQGIACLAPTEAWYTTKSRPKAGIRLLNVTDKEGAKVAHAMRARTVYDVNKWQTGRLYWTLPTLADVLYGLVLDGSIAINPETFEDWAADLGFDSDSIKARDTYFECQQIGATLFNMMTRRTFEALHEATADY